MSRYTIAFYNLENLFDTVNDPEKMDEDFTPQSDRKWNEDRLAAKVRKLGSVIARIGEQDNPNYPTLVGVAEVENEFVMQRLVDSPHLKELGYSFAHFNSPDERGVDTALIYRSSFFKVLTSEAIFVPIVTPKGHPDLTRDILHVTGELEGQRVHVLVNHWPSRRAGEDETAYRRMEAAKKNRTVIAAIKSTEPAARIIVMGDFNDDPHSASIAHLMDTDFYNPMQLLLTPDEGSATYRGQWNLFDQILVSNDFMKPYDNPFSFEKAAIFNEKSIIINKGKYKGNPFRTYAGDKYLGGVSDHFPVYAIFKIV
ncbi:MAG: endonuclease/exonuclease/phosphatase family metal-dependent hydrolase [Patiriisocius sp.]|jgi:endonuclease/exonuclease/phosphatase family metal-dependent hydrolase